MGGLQGAARRCRRRREAAASDDAHTFSDPQIPRFRPL